MLNGCVWVKKINCLKVKTTVEEKSRKYEHLDDHYHSIMYKFHDGNKYTHIHTHTTTVIYNGYMDTHVSIIYTCLSVCTYILSEAIIS